LAGWPPSGISVSAHQRGGRPATNVVQAVRGTASVQFRRATPTGNPATRSGEDQPSGYGDENIHAMNHNDGFLAISWTSRKPGCRSRVQLVTLTRQSGKAMTMRDMPVELGAADQAHRAEMRTRSRNDADHFGDACPDHADHLDRHAQQLIDGTGAWGTRKPPSPRHCERVRPWSGLRAWGVVVPARNRQLSDGRVLGVLTGECAPSGFPSGVVP
jgi:hypothetical protein